jgi:hypothetical protein
MAPSVRRQPQFSPQQNSPCSAGTLPPSFQRHILARKVAWADQQHTQTSRAIVCAVDNPCFFFPFFDIGCPFSFFVSPALVFFLLTFDGF